jgi:hypothetical protein
LFISLSYTKALSHVYLCLSISRLSLS